MENIEAITAFFGWCTLINLSIYTATTLALIGCKEPIKTIHSKITSVPNEKLDELYFNYLSNFKIAIITLNIVPYVSLKLAA